MLFKVSWLCIKIDEKTFVNPERSEIENACKRIQNWDASSKHKHTPKIGVVLSVDVIRWELRP